MKTSSENWTDVNDKLRVELENASTIDRLLLHEYQVCIGIGQLEICSYFKIEAWREDTLLFELNADYRNRSERAFQICEIVGKVASDCTCRDSGIYISISSDYMLVFRRDVSMESYAISSEAIGVVVI